MQTCPDSILVSTRYLAALLDYDRARATSIVREVLRRVGSLEHVYVDVLQPALYELGDRWERGEITIAQEHYCTAATQVLMSVLNSELVTRKPSGRRVLAASIGGNTHSVGIRMVADMFELHGWTTMFVGADTPAQSILETLSRESFDVLALSATLDSHVAELEHVVHAVRAAHLEIRILVGGRAFIIDPELWRRIGADGHATSAERAVAIAESLVADRTRPRLRALSLVETIKPPRVPDPDARSLDALAEINTELYDMARALTAKNTELAVLNTQHNRVMGVLAHDLRNPLSVIAAYSNFLREDLAGTLGAEQVEYLTSIDESSEFMRRLVDDSLDMSRLVADKLTIRREPIELVAFTRRVSAHNQHLAQRKSITLRVSSEQPTIEVAVDPSKIHQVINNLVGNAIQYSRPNSVIDIALDSDATTVTLVVHDQGLGIAADEVGTVFLPFTTTRTRGTAGEKSTGLGLAIVQSIVEAHQGRVRVESTLGEGSTFSVTLPRS